MFVQEGVGGEQSYGKAGRPKNAFLALAITLVCHKMAPNHQN